MSRSPFHEGELRVQMRVGVREAVEPWARQAIRGYMTEQQCKFFSGLPFVVAAARDLTGRPWATLLGGPPGFVESPDDRSLALETRPFAGDALEESLTAGTRLALLGIELETRRRNRINGTITESGAAGFRFEVEQAFGNCPQYITERSWSVSVSDKADALVSHHDRLDDDMQAWILSADTMFIASGYDGDGACSDSFGMDVSHRGGMPGFVELRGDSQLAIPDYPGNNHFNTLGNVIMDPRVGLLFIDFEDGSLLQLTGTATIDWAPPDTESERLIVVDIDAIVRLECVLPLRWSEPDGSSFSLRVARRIRESDDALSFILVARDGSSVPVFEAGQHLPIELTADGLGRPVNRTYSLSNSPDEAHYRITVKRHPDGLMSRLMHDVLVDGDVIRSKPPAGDFVLACTASPTVLISAGIGITPMVSMLHRLCMQGAEYPVVVVHGARDGSHAALVGEVRELAAGRGNVRVHVSFSRPRPEDVAGRDYDRAGRITGELLAELLLPPDAEFYVCGPALFLADISSALVGLGVPPGRIRSETFGSGAAARSVLGSELQRGHG